MNTRIDITQKEPAKREKNWKTSLVDALFYTVQWTWGLPVNLVGGLMFLYFTKIKGYRWQHFGYSKIVYMPWNGGGLSMGLFIFIKDNHKDKKWTYNCRIHEYGHTWQCLLLGPLYYLVIALPSVIWCNCFKGYRQKKQVPYSAVYCEKWADLWGQKFSGMIQAPDFNHTSLLKEEEKAE